MRLYELSPAVRMAAPWQVRLESLPARVLSHSGAVRKGNRVWKEGGFNSPPHVGKPEAQPWSLLLPDLIHASTSVSKSIGVAHARLAFRQGRESIEQGQFAPSKPYLLQDGDRALRRSEADAARPVRTGRRSAPSGAAAPG